MNFSEKLTRLRNLFCPLLDTFRFLLKICWSIEKKHKREGLTTHIFKKTLKMCC